MSIYCPSAHRHYLVVFTTGLEAPDTEEVAGEEDTADEDMEEVGEDEGVAVAVLDSMVTETISGLEFGGEVTTAVEVEVFMAGDEAVRLVAVGGWLPLLLMSWVGMASVGQGLCFAVDDTGSFIVVDGLLESDMDVLVNDADAAAETNNRVSGEGAAAFFDALLTVFVVLVTHLIEEVPSGGLGNKLSVELGLRMELDGKV